MECNCRKGPQAGSPKIARRAAPNQGQIAAARLIIKRVEEGKSTMEVTPEMRWVANQGR